MAAERNTGDLFLSGLSAQEQEALTELAETVELKTGMTLFTSGGPKACLFVLTSGRLAVSRETGFNAKQQVVALLSPGALVGEGCLGGDGNRNTTVTAIEDAVLLKLKKRILDEAEKKQPQLMFSLYKAAVRTASIRLQKCTERLVHIL